ncbi:PH-like domain-containing protein [Actinotalea solisilvae]|uniref:PH-like domain-containing protein n=1 Tax=Actinotalea solisilvae TaxID=2072922 RepID=UPI0018F16F5B|nr:hypothetical protein [Actinotalea solisilvae]
MREALGIAVLVVLLVVVLLAMRAGWRSRAARSATLVPALPPVPAPDALGAVRLGPVEATYVSTTVAGDWLDRVVAHDLGARSAASVTVHDAGVLLTRAGARDLFVPAAALRDAHLAPGIAGKVAGGEGVVVLRWEVVGARGARLGGDAPGATVLDSGLRPRRSADRQALVSAVRALVAAGAAAGGVAGVDGAA